MSNPLRQIDSPQVNCASLEQERKDHWTSYFYYLRLEKSSRLCGEELTAKRAKLAAMFHLSAAKSLAERLKQ